MELASAPTYRVASSRSSRNRAWSSSSRVGFVSLQWRWSLGSGLPVAGLVHSPPDAAVTVGSPRTAESLLCDWVGLASHSTVSATPFARSLAFAPWAFLNVATGGQNTSDCGALA